MKSNTQGVDLSIIGPKGNVQVNDNFARPVKTAHASNAVKGSAASENQSAKLGRKPVGGSATNQNQRISSLGSGSKIMHGNPCYQAS